MTQEQACRFWENIVYNMVNQGKSMDDAIAAADKGLLAFIQIAKASKLEDARS